MSENEIKLLKQQINSLEAKKYDLEAWKSHTIIFVSRIFGLSSEHLRLIQELKYDYSSWSLRDTSGSMQLTDPVRTRAREILEAAITELEVFGSPSKQTSTSEILEPFRKSLTGNEIDELERILNLPDTEKPEKLKAFFSGKEKEILTSILVELLMTSAEKQ